MSKIEMLRLLINQRLTAAAEEIFDVFGRTIVEYEKEISRSRLEIDRQRRLLELSRKPRISLQADSSAVSEQQDWSSSAELNKEEPPSHIKEEDVWSDPPGETNVGFLLFQNNSARTQQDNNSTESLDSKFCQDLTDPDVDPQPGTSVQQTCSELSDDQPGAAGNSRDDSVDITLPKAVGSYICTICGQAFHQRSQWAKHTRKHRKVDSKGNKSFTCDICGKRLTRSDGYQKHLRVHTGEKPYSCHVCGRSFSDNSNFKRHIRGHMKVKSQQRTGDMSWVHPAYRPMATGDGKQPSLNHSQS